MSTRYHCPLPTRDDMTMVVTGIEDRESPDFARERRKLDALTDAECLVWLTGCDHHTGDGVCLGHPEATA
ncbi:MAG: hypothetical protein IT179_14445 [Acidobacteria bacterium]|nr:hypothetical protein [Acidobacteriota bacterium]